MTRDEAVQIFRDSGALLEGHFLLRSGLHSRQFFQCALALQQMPVVEKLGAAIAAKVKKLGAVTVVAPARSEEHTSELQSRRDLVCRLLLEKKKKNNIKIKKTKKKKK